MSEVIDAIFEDGVFKPLGKVGIKEHERLRSSLKKLKALQWPQVVLYLQETAGLLICFFESISTTADFPIDK
ncbi:MAG: antitoxin family protein [Nitrospirota bacterium]